jgi:hypothetical protein
MLPRTLAMLAALAAARAALAQEPDARTTDGWRQTIERALRECFRPEAGEPELAQAARLARGREDQLLDVLRKKSWLLPGGPQLVRGRIDEHGRFVEAADEANPAWFAAPAAGRDLLPLVVYVPDVVDTGPFGPSLGRDATALGCTVFLVPDERRDNKWKPTPHEHRRHIGPLRELLLQQPIDPDRVCMIGSGRGGHATWDVGLLNADRWSGLAPCNGGLIHEGGFASTGGVFLENAACLSIATVYNTTFDHGIESCRHAGRKFREWGYRFTAVEEERMRCMDIPEAMQRLDGAVRDAHPKTLQKRFNRLADGGHYWLTALARAKEWDPSDRITVRGNWPQQRQQQLELVWEQVKGSCALLRGSIRDNRVDVTAQGVTKLRVWFDPVLLDFGRKVTVAVNGRVAATVAPERKIEVLLRHVRETGDTARLYWDHVDVQVGK